ncbi:MAG: hypothetical protein V2B19_32855 [Pseudomonadota bacterium]
MTEIEALKRENEELRALVGRVLQESDHLFNSITWKIGYAVACFVRRIRVMMGNRTLQGHIGPGYFHLLAEQCVAYRRSSDRIAFRIDGSPDNVPSEYIKMDVDVALGELWHSISRKETSIGS